MNRDTCIKATPVVALDLSHLLNGLAYEESVQFGLDEGLIDVEHILPDGRECIRTRLWKLISNSKYGEQVFTNDSYFRYVFPSLNGEDFISGDQELLFMVVEPYVVDHQVLFNVSW